MMTIPTKQTGTSWRFSFSENDNGVFEAGAAFNAIGLEYREEDSLRRLSNAERA